MAHSNHMAHFAFLFRKLGILKLYATFRFADGDLRHNWMHKFGREGFPCALHDPKKTQKLQSLDFDPGFRAS
jgi:hypothetical protein